MRERLRPKAGRRVCGIFVAAAFLCLVSAPALALDDGPGLGTAAVSIDPEKPFVPFPLARGQKTGTQAFEGSRPNDQPLQQQLSQPLRLQGTSNVSLSPGGSEARGIGSRIDYSLESGLNLQGSLSLGEQRESFTALGSIHCVNGTLDAVSYRASNCYFVDDAAGGTGSVITLGAAYDLGQTARASLNLFQQRSQYQDTNVTGVDANALALLDPMRPSNADSDPLFSVLNPALSGAQLAESEMSGVDVEFQVGISTDQAGDIVLGLQLTRVLDSGMEGVYYANAGGRNWTIAEPFDSARVSVDWAKGNFSGGMQSYYRSAVNFVNQNQLDSQATFDVHFTWRAPWNASVSVGASNILGASSDEQPANDNALVDPFESIYGRIPYVRYKQDL